MNNKRLFAAIDLSPVEKQALHCVAYELRAQFAEGRINTEDMYHITLHFFVEVPEDRIPDIGQAMKLAAKGQAPFTMVTGFPAIFGSPDSAVVWISLSEGLEPLATLQQRLEKQLVKAGFLEDARPFRPHITLGREIDTTAFQTPLGELNLPSINLAAGSLTLLESKVANGRPVYEPLLRVRFAKKG